jgi:hypothetical protein
MKFIFEMNTAVLSLTLILTRLARKTKETSVHPEGVQWVSDGLST